MSAPQELQLLRLYVCWVTGLETLRVGTSDDVEKLVKGDVWIGNNSVSDLFGRYVNKKGIELALPKIISGFNGSNAENLLDTLSTIGEIIDEHCQGFFEDDDASDLGRKIHYAARVTEYSIHDQRTIHNTEFPANNTRHKIHSTRYIVHNTK